MKPTQIRQSVSGGGVHSMQCTIRYAMHCTMHCTMHHACTTLLYMHFTMHCAPYIPQCAQDWTWCQPRSFASDLSCVCCTAKEPLGDPADVSQGVHAADVKQGVESVEYLKCLLSLLLSSSHLPLTCSLTVTLSLSCAATLLCCHGRGAITVTELPQLLCCHRHCTVATLSMPPVTVTPVKVDFS